MKTIQPIIILLCCFCQMQLNGQSPVFNIEIESQTYSIEERMAEHQVNGMSYIAVKNFEIDTIIYKGYRDAEHQLPVDENTLFQMGSMTGALTKFAIIRLVNEGKIDLDAAANDYLKSWKIPQQSFTKNKPITVRDLLTQKRGMNDIYKPKGYLPNTPTPTLIQILNGEKPSNLGAMIPKKDRNKSGNSSMVNNMILQQILEDMHAKSFAEIIETAVFQPLQMNKSLIRAELSDKEKENAAVGYEQDKEKRIEGDRWVYPELGVAGLWSTPEDYMKFVLHVFKAANGIDNTLINQDLAQASIEPETGNTALILLKNGTNYWGGAPEGFYSQFQGDAKTGNIIVASTNKHLCWKFINWELLPTGTKYLKN